MLGSLPDCARDGGVKQVEQVGVGAGRFKLPGATFRLKKGQR